MRSTTPKAPQRRDTPKPQRLRTFTRIPKGPRMYQQPTRPKPVGGPGDPPPGFLDPSLHGSATEWVIYWALAKIFRNPADPRMGPYMGGPPDWQYQKWAMGGRSQAGGAVVDFVVFTAPGGKMIGLRVATEYFHTHAHADKQASDRLQRELLSREFDIVDLIDVEFLSDRTGQAAIVKIKHALGMIQSPDPIRAGTVRRNRG